MSGRRYRSSKGGAGSRSVDDYSDDESIDGDKMAEGCQEGAKHRSGKEFVNERSSDREEVPAGIFERFAYWLLENDERKDKKRTRDNRKKKKSTLLSHSDLLREQQEYDRKRLQEVEQEEAERRETNRKESERREAEWKETLRREEEERERSMRAVKEEGRLRREEFQRQKEEYNAMREKLLLERQRKDDENPEPRNIDEDIKTGTTSNEISIEPSVEEQREIIKMKEKVQCQRSRMKELKEEAAERSRKLHEESKHAARKMGQQSARLITNAIRQTYERGVRDGMKHVKDMLERAGSKENGILIVHDNEERSVEIAENLAQVFQDRNFVVPPLVREDDQLPPCTTKCRLKWLVLYHILTDDRPRIRHTVSESNRYFSNEAFRDCAKCLIIQTGKMPDEHERSKALNFSQKTTVIISSAPDFHTKVIERALNNSESFDKAIEKMKSAAKSDGRCILRA